MAMLMPWFELNMAAMRAVSVVPMFAPKINGAACFKPITFFATKGTTNEVVTVLDRMSAVVSNPQPNDLKELLKKNRLNLSCELKPNVLVKIFRKNRIDP